MSLLQDSLILDSNLRSKKLLLNKDNKINKGVNPKDKLTLSKEDSQTNREDTQTNREDSQTNREDSLNKVAILNKEDSPTREDIHNKDMEETPSKVSEVTLNKVTILEETLSKDIPNKDSEVIPNKEDSLNKDLEEIPNKDSADKEVILKMGMLKTISTNNNVYFKYFR
jgi:hypothetical protein